jgi:multidrug resistance protein, MATE family
MSALPGRVSGPAITLRDVLAIALPITLSNATAPLVGLVDTAVIGQLGQPHLIGGVAIAANIFNTVYWLFGFLRMGTTGFAAQATGADDAQEVAATLLRALGFAVIAGVMLIICQVPVRTAFLYLLGGSDAVQATARTYFDIRIWAAPAGLINLALMGWFIGLGRAMTAFYLQLGLNAMNIVLAIGLVMVAGFEVAGVGTAALVAEVIAAAAGLMLARREALARGTRPVWASVLDVTRFKTVLAASGDIMLRTACVLAVVMIFVAQGAKAGDATLAANAVLSSILMVSIYFLDGYAFAVETLVGQAVGARDRQRFDAAVRLATLACAATGVVVSALVWVLGPLIIDGMTTSAEVRAGARTFLMWAAVSPLIGIWCFLLDGIFIGATRTRDMRNMMLISFAVFLAALAVLVPWLGNHGLWAAYNVFFITRAITLLSRYPDLRRSLLQE